MTVGGRSADLSGGGKYPVYLTIKRALRRGHGTAITALAIINSGKVRVVVLGNKMESDGFSYANDSVLREVIVEKEG